MSWVWQTDLTDGTLADNRDCLVPYTTSVALHTTFPALNPFLWKDHDSCAKDLFELVCNGSTTNGYDCLPPGDDQIKPEDMRQCEEEKRGRFIYSWHSCKMIQMSSIMAT
jgi:hypothetical protein